MSNDNRKKAESSGRRPSLDRWVWIVSGVSIASFAGLISSDLLPAALEGLVVMALLCLYGLYGATMLGGFVWGAIAMLNWLYLARPQFRLLAFLIAACVVLAVIGALSVGLDIAGLLAAAALQLLTPVVVVFGVRPRSPWCATSFGGAVALVGIVVYIFLYALIFGIEGGYPFPDMGPGLRGLPHVVGLLCLCSLTVFPVIITLVAGAIGGVVGWGLRRKAQ